MDIKHVNQGLLATNGCPLGETPAHEHHTAPPRDTFVKTPGGDYHFKPDNDVFQDASGQWHMKLPNADIPMPGRPVWLDRFDKLNTILDANPEPRVLRGHVDEITRIADKSYDASSLKFEPADLQAYVGGIHDANTLSDLHTIYGMYLADETQSTYQIGGAMAGSRCSQMHKYGAIMQTLEEAQQKAG